MKTFYRSLLGVGSLLVVSATLLYVLLTTLITCQESITFPRNLPQLKTLAQCLVSFSTDHFLLCSLAYICTYTFLQTFAIPGSLMLSILGGYLFGLPIGLLYVCLCSATGASLCYLISDAIGGPIIDKYFSERLGTWNRQLSGERKHLFNYMVFLRVTPFLPNWFINMASPHLHVPLGTFWVGTFVGVAPPSFVHVQGGRALTTLNDTSELLTPLNALALAVISILSILPVVIRRYWPRMMDYPDEVVALEDESLLNGETDGVY